MPDDPAKLPRFPYIAALLCAACLGAAAWTWMRYSYCWPLSFADVNERENRWLGAWLEGAYAELTGPPVPFDRPGTWAHVLCDNPEAPAVAVTLVGEGSAQVVGQDARCEYRGRLFPAYELEDDISPSSQFPDRRQPLPIYLGLDTTRSRFTGASVAGLVVGAMGVFVLTVALRHWLGERRAWREKTEGITTG